MSMRLGDIMHVSLRKGGAMMESLTGLGTSLDERSESLTSLTLRFQRDKILLHPEVFLLQWILHLIREEITRDNIKQERWIKDTLLSPWPSLFPAPCSQRISTFLNETGHKKSVTDGASQLVSPSDILQLFASGALEVGNEKYTCISAAAIFHPVWEQGQDLQKLANFLRYKR